MNLTFKGNWHKSELRDLIESEAHAVSTELDRRGYRNLKLPVAVYPTQWLPNTLNRKPLAIYRFRRGPAQIRLAGKQTYSTTQRILFHEIGHHLYFSKMPYHSRKHWEAWYTSQIRPLQPDILSLEPRGFWDLPLPLRMNLAFAIAHEGSWSPRVPHLPIAKILALLPEKACHFPHSFSLRCYDPKNLARKNARETFAEAFAIFMCGPTAIHDRELTPEVARHFYPFLQFAKD